MSQVQFVVRRTGDDNELMHYGVRGMKWGVRRGHASSAFAKASRKATRLSAKIDKTQRKLDKRLQKEEKLTKRATSFTLIGGNGRQRMQKAGRAHFKAAMTQKKLTKLQNKAQKWESAMSETFKNVKAKDIQQKHLDKGKKYTHMLSVR